MALIADLDDDGLREFVDYWEFRRAAYKESGDGYSSWWCSKHISAGLIEGKRRAQRDLERRQDTD